MALAATNKRSRIKLVMADIDETLVTREKLLTPRSVQAAQRLKDAGTLFGVTTGRPQRAPER
jgi:hydroxymethylpyrimidine pyrophosphatase-like HAD family hydrolase